MSLQQAPDLDQQIKAKKSEAHAAWKVYVEAFNNAEASRYTLQRTRESLHKEVEGGGPIERSAFVMLDGLAEIQSGMDEKVQQLGLRCDTIGRELSALQLMRGAL